MILNPFHKTIYELLLQNKQFRIPRYQREYVWGQREWDQLFVDITENDKGYYLGTILYVYSDDNKDKVEVIDGQQRLLTFSILVAALYEKYQELSKANLIKNSSDPWTQSIYTDLIKCLVDFTKSPEGTSAIKLIPQKQNSNDEDYFHLLSNLKIINNSSVIRNYGNRRISKAFNFFKKQIDEYLNNSNDLGEALKELIILFENASIIEIQTTSYSDANLIFEALNNRGAPLSSVDLLKNILLAFLESSNEDKNNYYYNLWLEILDNLGNYSSQERFFRQNYNAFRKKLNEPWINNSSSKYPLGVLATRSTLIPIYEKLIKKDPNFFINEILENSKIYGQLTLKNKEDLPNFIVQSLRRLNNIKGVASYVLLLYLLKNKEQLELTDEQLNSIIDYLVKFFVRRNLTDTPATRNLNRIFMTLVEKIESDYLVGNQIVTEVKKYLRNISASDQVFENKLRGNIYIDNTDVTRFILTSLAEEGMTRENMIDLWERFEKSDNYKWSIEHVLVQTTNLSEEWIDMIADGDMSKALEYQQEYVHKLGNLTITAYNSKLSDYPFLKKRDLKNDKGKYTGYKNGLAINEDLKDAEIWNIEKIQARTDCLVKQTLELFKLDD